jgi:hypothetical protein
MKSLKMFGEEVVEIWLIIALCCFRMEIVQIMNELLCGFRKVVKGRVLNEGWRDAKVGKTYPKPFIFLLELDPKNDLKRGERELRR